MTSQEIFDLVKDSGFGFLATTEGKQPRVRPMMPYLTDDGNLLFALLSQSRTIKQIQENPLVEICYVDRKMWLCRISGRAKISQNLEKKEIVWNNVPMLRQYFSGPEDPNFILMEIDSETIEAMTPTMRAPEKINFK